MISESDLDEFVRTWLREIIGTSYVPRARQEIEVILQECARELVASLVAERFDTGAAESVAVRLVDAHFTGSAALDRSLRLFATGLLKLVEPIAVADPLPRVIAVIGAFGAAFADGLRDRTLEEQEVIQQSVLTAKDVAEEARRASEARFRAVFTSSAVGIAVADLRGRLLTCNGALEEITGQPEDELIGWTVYAFASVSGADELAVQEADLADGVLDRFHVQCEFVSGDERTVVTGLAVSLVRDATGGPSYQVVLVEDVTDRHMLQQELHRQATHDPLTGLANRTLLSTRMESALELAYPGRRVGLCYFDLDGFKAINDSLGHPIGDDLLRAVAQRLQVLANSEDALAVRMGGDEFVVLIPDSRGTTAIIELVEYMLRELTRPVRIGGHELNASASAGVVEREVAGLDRDELLSDADITLYRAKSEGKAQWMLFDPEINEASRTRFRLSATMPSALDENEFFVEYRPITWLDGGHLLAVEADIRWDHPDFGELGTEDFRELAEETGLTVRLGNRMLRQVCEHAARWAEQLGEAAPIVAVSLSQRHFRDPELVGDVQAILHETGMSAGKLRLVVPENALFDDQGDPVDLIDIFGEMGLRLIAEDFGTQGDRLARMRDVPLDMVRITGACLHRFGRADVPDPIDEHIVVSLVKAAQLLGLTVITDGVDGCEQAERLGKTGVHAVQGEYTGGLASAMEIEAMLAGSGSAGR